ncbi:MAG: hypothetical protein K6G22_05510 [Lachnospiraceae bacterium]|nr:hypothetical protein [Lachnospiraceae bacterium]
MKLFDWIKRTLGFDDEGSDNDDFFLNDIKTGDSSEAMTEVLSSVSLKRENLNVLDYKDRERFVRDHCEQMVACSKDIEEQKLEFKVVMEHLNDIEEITSLPGQDLDRLAAKADKIIDIEEAEKKYKRPASKISEAQYREMSRYETDGIMPEALDRLTESESVQMKIKRDLNLLEGEKGALAYQRKEENKRALNSKTVCMLLVIVSILIFALLLFLQNSLKMDIRIGVFMLLGVLAIGLTAVFVIYTDARSEQSRAERKLNRAIVLQNKAKVRYVNATNLIDYYYSKYKVNSSYELRYMWEKYLEEKKARNHSEEVAKQMEEARVDLLNDLRRHGIREPSVFVYQPGLLTDEDEMTEMRHSLIIQRQRLKKGMDFNSYNLDNSKKEIERLVKDYPQYAREILAIVSQYEENGAG